MWKTEATIRLLDTYTFAADVKMDRAELIEAYRAHARRTKEGAERILAAKDEDFVIETENVPDFHNNQNKGGE